MRRMITSKQIEQINKIIIAPNNTLQTLSNIKNTHEDEEYRYYELTEGSFIKIVINQWKDKDISLRPALGMSPISAKIYFYNNSGTLIHNYLIQSINGESPLYNTDGSDFDGETYASFENSSGDNEGTTRLNIKILNAIQGKAIDTEKCNGRMEIELYMGPGFQNTKYL